MRGSIGDAGRSFGAFGPVFGPKAPTPAGNLLRRTATLGLTSIVALLACPGAAGAGQGGRFEADYRGRTIGSPRGEVLIDIRSRGGERRKAIFKVRNIGIFCEDGTVPRIDFVQMRARFSSKRRFEGVIGSTDQGGEFYYRVDGWLGQGGRAWGEFFWLRNANATNAPNGVDCSSRRTAWEAQRVR